MKTEPRSGGDQNLQSCHGRVAEDGSLQDTGKGVEVGGVTFRAKGGANVKGRIKSVEN